VQMRLAETDPEFQQLMRDLKDKRAEER
jgi:hypothetical protein